MKGKGGCAFNTDSPDTPSMKEVSYGVGEKESLESLSPFEKERKKRKFIAFQRLIDMKKSHPIGTINEILSWKDEGRK